VPNNNNNIITTLLGRVHRYQADNFQVALKWIENYERENKEEEDRRKELQARLTAGLDAVKTW
jgi:hypothetical protein